MASARALAVLAAVAAALVAAAAWDLWHPGEREAAPATRRLLPGCDVTRVRWERPQQPPVILEPAAGDRHVLRVRRHGRDLALPADPRAARDVLGTLELLAHRRAMPARRAERGLDRPRLRLHVTCADGHTAILALGQRLVPLDRVWMARTGHGEARAGQPVDYLIEGYAARALDRPADALRARRVFASLQPGSLPGDVRIDIREGERALVLGGDPALVHLDALWPGARVRADPDRVSELVGLLRDLAITRFLDHMSGSEPPGPDHGVGRDGDPEPGHGAGALVIRVRGDDAATLEDLGACPASARIGAARPDAAGAGPAALRLVRTGIGTGCAPADVLASVAAFLDTASPGDVPGASMVSRALVDSSASLLRIHVEPAAGPAFTLHARGSAWSMSLAGMERDAGRGSDEPAETRLAEPAAVRDWLAALDAAPGTALLPARAPGAATEHSPASRAPRPGPAPAPGASPALTLTVAYAGGRVDRVALYRDPGARPADAPRWLALRNQEPVYIVLDAAPHAAAIAPVSPLRFRRRALLAREPYALREVIARQAGGVVERLERGQLLDEWRVLVPPGATVRPGAVDALRQAVARVRARRFVARAPLPAHRLDPPRRSIEAVFDPGPLDTGAPTRHRLELGAGTEHGCLARLDRRGPVFELDRATCDTLRGPWSRR